MRLAIVLSCFLLLGCATPVAPLRTEEPPASSPVPPSPDGPAASEGRPTAQNFGVISYRIEDVRTGTRIVGEVGNRGSIGAGVELQAVVRATDGTVIEDVRFWPAELRNIPPGATEPFSIVAPRAVIYGMTLEPVAARVWPTDASEHEFEILSYRVQDHLTGTRLIGQVRNNGASAAGVQLQGVARDATGTVVEEVQFWPAEARNIPSGAIQSFDVIGPRPGTRGFTLQPVGARVWQSNSLPEQPAGERLHLVQSDRTTSRPL